MVKPLIISVIVLGYFVLAVFYSIKYRFIQFRAVGETKKILVSEKNRSAYSTFMLSMASHMGTGNIVGISTALIYGGAGSLFGCGFIQSSLRFSLLMENTLAQVYKEKINEKICVEHVLYEKGLNNNFLSLVFAFFLLCTNTIFFNLYKLILLVRQ